MDAEGISNCVGLVGPIPWSQLPVAICYQERKPWDYSEEALISSSLRAVVIIRLEVPRAFAYELRNGLRGAGILE